MPAANTTIRDRHRRAIARDTGEHQQGGALIPRRIHAFWGGPPMPDHLADYLRKWRRMHPGWRFMLWTPNDLPPLRNQDMFDHPETWSPKSNPWQWRSDLARYEILHDIGGVYVDCDLEPLRKIDDLLGADFIAREDGKYVNNAFMGCQQGSPWMADILDGLRERATRKIDCRVNKSIGAWYLTERIAHHPEVRILPPESAYPYHWSELDRHDDDHGDAYTVHHWHNKRTMEGA